MRSSGASYTVIEEQDADVAAVISIDQTAVRLSRRRSLRDDDPRLLARVGVRRTTIALWLLLGPFFQRTGITSLESTEFVGEEKNAPFDSFQRSSRFGHLLFQVAREAHASRPVERDRGEQCEEDDGRDGPRIGKTDRHRAHSALCKVRLFFWRSVDTYRRADQHSCSNSHRDSDVRLRWRNAHGPSTVHL